MKKLLRALAVVVVFLFIAIGSFVLGHKSRNNQMNIEIASVQAMQWFNHLLRFRELEADLSKGCSTVALEKVRISIATEMTLLSSFYKEHKSTSMNKYITDRDPTLLKELENFTSKYGNSWVEPLCAK